MEGSFFCRIVRMLNWRRTKYVGPNLVFVAHPLRGSCKCRLDRITNRQADRRIDRHNKGVLGLLMSNTLQLSRGLTSISKIGMTMYKSTLMTSKFHYWYLVNYMTSHYQVRLKAYCVSQFSTYTTVSHNIHQAGKQTEGKR